MAKITKPTILHDFKILADENSLAGVANKITIPSPKMLTVEHDMAGGGKFTRTIKRVDELEASITVSEVNDKMLSYLDPAEADKQVTFRGAFEEDGEIKTAIIRIAGYWQCESLSELTPGANVETEYKCSVVSIHFEVNGIRKYSIDKLNNEFYIGNKNLLDDVQEALG